MKFKISLILILLLAIPLQAQVVYPVSILVGWDKNPDVEQVIDYTVVHNNGSTNTTFVVLHSACTFPTTDGQCHQVISVPGAIAQTVTITPRNQWGMAIPESVTFTVTAPGKARNIKIRAN